MVNTPLADIARSDVSVGNLTEPFAASVRPSTPVILSDPETVPETRRLLSMRNWPVPCDKLTATPAAATTNVKSSKSITQLSFE